MKKIFKIADNFELKLKDKLPGGRADSANIQSFDRVSLLRGMREEMEEHTNDPQIALEIAMDHLSEDPNYYNK